MLAVHFISWLAVLVACSLIFCFLFPCNDVALLCNSSSNYFLLHVQFGVFLVLAKKWRGVWKAVAAATESGSSSECVCGVSLVLQHRSFVCF